MGMALTGLPCVVSLAALNDEVKQVRDVAETTLIGGLRRQVRVELDASRLIAYGIDPNEVVVKLDAANRQSRAGSLPTPEGEILVETGGFLANVGQVGAVVVGAYQGQLVYLRDLAQVLDGPEEPTDYVLFGRGPRQDGADPCRVRVRGHAVGSDPGDRQATWDQRHRGKQPGAGKGSPAPGTHHPGRRWRLP